MDLPCWLSSVRIARRSNGWRMTGVVKSRSCARAFVFFVQQLHSPVLVRWMLAIVSWLLLFSAVLLQTAVLPRSCLYLPPTIDVVARLPDKARSNACHPPARSRLCGTLKMFIGGLVVAPTRIKSWFRSTDIVVRDAFNPPRIASLTVFLIRSFAVPDLRRSGCSCPRRMASHPPYRQHAAVSAGSNRFGPACRWAKAHADA